MDSTVASEPETVLAELGLSRELTIQWTVVSTLGFLVSLGLFGALYGLLTGAEAAYLVQLSDVGWWNQALELIVFVGLTTIIIVPHELVHGLAIKYYGGEPRYGVGIAHFILPYAYATTDHRLTRDQFIIVALAPLVVLTLVGVALMGAFDWGWLVVPLAANAGGAVGDLWMVLMLLGYPPHVQVEDSVTGFRILGRSTDEPRAHSVMALVWDAIVGVSVGSLGIMLLVGLAGPFVLLSLGVESVPIGRPGTITHLIEFTNTPNEISYTVGPGGLLLGGVFGLVYALVRTAM